MTFATLALGLILLNSTPPPPSAEDMAAYNQAKTLAGRDADAHVRLALWCEAHGMPDERAVHLATALAIDPGNTLARGLRAQLLDGKTWRNPEALPANASLAEILAEYNAKRARAAQTPEAQWSLTLWCESKGLKAEATAHATATTRLAPGHELAWKHLGYKKRDGRWKTDAQIAAEKADARLQAEADRRFVPLFEKYRDWLGGSRDQKTRAETQLGLVVNARAVPAVLKIFGKGPTTDQIRAIRLLAQIDAAAATRGLATLAVTSRSDEVRDQAIQTLKTRDNREVVDLLIGRLKDEVKFEVKPGDNGTVGTLLVEGRKYDLKRVYESDLSPEFALQSGDVTTRDADGFEVIRRSLNGQPLAAQAGSMGMPGPMAGLIKIATNNPLTASEVDIPVGRMRQEAQKSGQSAQMQLDRDVALLKQRNETIGTTNARIATVLTALTGQTLAADPKTWRTWWSEELGYTYEPVRMARRSTRTELVSPLYQSQAIAPTYVANVALQPGGGFGGHQHCFAAGTLVRTRAGLVPIESLKVGDLVLSQDSGRGELALRPVLQTFRNAPITTLRLEFSEGNDAVVATEIHRFWKAGHGWVMARDLRPGDTLRTLGGVARLRKVTADAVQPVYNLEVAESRSFFAGPNSILVHDNTAAEPVATPFDAFLPNLASTR